MPFGGIVVALPPVILAAANVTPLRSLYLCSAVGNWLRQRRPQPSLGVATRHRRRARAFFRAPWRSRFTRSGARSPVRRDDRALGHGADRCVDLDGRPPRAGLQPWRHPVHPALAPRDRTPPGRRKHPLLTVGRLCQCRWHRRRAALGDEPVSSLPPPTHRNLELYRERVAGCICSESTARVPLQVVRPKETTNRRRRRLAPAPTRARALRCSW
jgi:hypothetical protein